MHKLCGSAVEGVGNKREEVHLAFFSTEFERVRPLSKSATAGVASAGGRMRYSFQIMSNRPDFPFERERQRERQRQADRVREKE